MVISVASGKGGTGKTTVSTNLAWTAANQEPVAFIDCDVEEPDSHFYLKPAWTGESEVKVSVPSVDGGCCDGCGACAEFCKFNALAAIKGGVLVFAELCHSCGGCKMVCPKDCIEMAERRVGLVKSGNASGILVKQGLLDIGEPMAVPIIKELKKELPGCLTIIDCPPGTSCPMIETVTGTDFCLMVTEPSPFGLHDLALAHEVADEIGVSHGVVINKSSEHDSLIEEFCSKSNIPVLGRVPFSMETAVICSRGDLAVEVDPAMKTRFEDILKEVESFAQAAYDTQR
ncbi:MAG: ATP-binding protein [Actinobacteria bacterium]|nr:ATP-binding protein [Actinomycetota bacterium]